MRKNVIFSTDSLKIIINIHYMGRLFFLFVDNIRKKNNNASKADYGEKDYPPKVS